MKIVPLLFQIVFYTGSWVPPSKYKPLVRQLEKHPGVENVRFHKWFESPPQGRNDTLLVGHSLGGYFALRDAVQHPERVAGVVLLNSHFNSRGVMPYPGIPIEKVDVPVLTVLGGKDDRLPIRKAMDDAWECVQERDSNKYFKINKDFTHWTGVTEVLGQEQIVRPIHRFVRALETRNFTEMRQMDTYRNRFRPDLFYLSTDAVVASQSVNIIDAIMGLVLPRAVWNFAHFLWFLTAKPDEVLSFLFVDDNHLFLKGKEKDNQNYARLLEEWMRDVPFEIRDYYLPPLHPLILFWLFFPLVPCWKNDRIIAPRIILEVNNETTYYKVPNPRKFFNLLPSDSFFDF